MSARPGGGAGRGVSGCVCVCVWGGGCRFGVRMGLRAVGMDVVGEL